MEKRTIWLLAGALFVLIIFFQNLRFVDLKILFFSVKLPLILLLVGVFILGMFANRFLSK